MSCGDVDQLSRLIHARGWEAVLARGHARQGRELSPAERGPGGCEFLGHGPVVFFGVKRAIFADGVAQHKVEHGTLGSAQLAIPVNQSTRTGLVLGLDGDLGLGQQRVGLDVANLFTMLGERVSFRGLAARLARRVIGADNQAGERIALVTDARDVPPGIGRVGGMNAHRGAVDASLGLGRGVLPGATGSWRTS